MNKIMNQFIYGNREARRALARRADLVVTYTVQLQQLGKMCGVQ